MPTYKSPDVYVEEISILPPSVAEVDTAVPAFIGYTEIAYKVIPEDLRNIPTKIYSFNEFKYYYGGPDPIPITVTIQEDKEDQASGFAVKVEDPNPGLKFLLYYSVKMFFDNGGGPCYIVSVGKYDRAGGVKVDELKGGLDKLTLEDEPTLLVVPDAVKLNEVDFGVLAQAQLKQCNDLGDRFAIFDLHGGDKDLDTPTVATKRGLFGNNFLKYGAAYYPFVRSALNFFVKSDESNVMVNRPAPAPAAPPVPRAGGAPPPAPPPPPANPAALGTLANTETAIYNLVKQQLKSTYVILPPGGAVAGIYAATDANRGVWKAPANVSLADVVEPMVRLDGVRQAGLNVDPDTGKSINAVRSFAGKGVLVWGSRTLAGNDNEWRYVPVRRFFIMVEQSVKRSTYWAVFEPNDANTWVKVRGMIENYLTQKWREGALAGSTPKDAFFVRCGLGTTMNVDDVLEGRMNVEIGMAAVRPAEFIILKFSHKLQTS